MQNDIPEHTAETPGAPASDAGTTVPVAAQASTGRRNAWIGMLAVAAALVMLTLISEPGSVDSHAPPPAADAAEGTADGEDAAGAPVGQDAPLHYTLKDLNGVDVTLASFKGKVILLNFWATWCGPCRVEIPDLIELQNKYADDLVVLGISVDDSPEKMRPYATAMKINYPLLVGRGRDDVQEAFGPLWGIPVSVFIGRDGKIHKRHSGIASKEEIEREITAAL